MENNIVAKIIRDAIIKQGAKILLPYILATTVVMFMQQDVILMLTNKCKTVNSAHEISEAFENGDNHIEFTANKIVLVAYSGDEVYLCAIFPDGAVFFQTLNSKYERGDFDGENIRLKGIIRRAKLSEDIREWTAEINSATGLFMPECVFEESPISSVIFYGVFVFILIVGILKCVFDCVFYKGTKAYKSLKYINYERPEDARDDINYDYNKNKNEHIFENKSVFVSKKFMIMKYPAAFRYTKKLNKVEELMTRGRNGKLYNIKAYFDDDEAPVNFETKNENEMKQVINILRTNVLCANVSAANENDNNF